MAHLPVHWHLSRRCGCPTNCDHLHTRFQIADKLRTPPRAKFERFLTAWSNIRLAATVLQDAVQSRSQFSGEWKISKLGFEKLQKLFVDTKKKNTKTLRYRNGLLSRRLLISLRRQKRMRCKCALRYECVTTLPPAPPPLDEYFALTTLASTPCHIPRRKTIAFERQKGGWGNVWRG